MSKEHNISNLSSDTGTGEKIVLEKEEILTRKYFLKGKNIGVSISESDDLTELGYGIPHLKDVLIEMARYILAAGGSLSYGGDMRQGGFTELIFDLLLNYKADKYLPPHERFYSYLAYPLSTQLSAEKQAELKNNVSFIKIPPPADLKIPDLNQYIAPDNVTNQYIWTRCLSEMRKKMEESCCARIFIGGKTKGFKGKYPGILEEILIAVEHKHPVYLIGAFGGITKEIIDVMNGKNLDSFKNEYYLDNNDYKELFILYNQKHSDNQIDYTGAQNKLQSIGLKAIAAQNGLSETDNLRLSITPHINEIVYLILKGLTHCFIK